MMYNSNENTFDKTMGLKLSYDSSGNCTGTLKLKEEHINAIGVSHGGVLFTVADTVAGMTLYTRFGRALTTESVDMRFLRPAKTGTVIKAVGEVVKSGKSIAVATAKIYDENEKILAIMTGSFCYLE